MLRYIKSKEGEAEQPLLSINPRILQRSAFGKKQKNARGCCWGANIKKSSDKVGGLAFNGDPGRIRTCGLLIRSQTLYPAELRSHMCNGRDLYYHYRRRMSTVKMFIHREMHKSTGLSTRKASKTGASADFSTFCEGTYPLFC